MSSWWPAYGHPECPVAGHACFVVTGDHVYPAPAHPDGTALGAWFRVAGAEVWALDAHPLGPSPAPWFEIVGSFVYPTSEHPAAHTGGAPWFVIR